MSRRQAIPSNWFVREGDPLPPLYPDPVDGDHYFNKVTNTLRVFVDGAWVNAAAQEDDISAADARYDLRYVNHDQFIVSTAPASGTPAGGIGTVWIQY